MFQKVCWTSVAFNDRSPFFHSSRGGGIFPTWTRHEACFKSDPSLPSATWASFRPWVMHGIAWWCSLSMARRRRAKSEDLRTPDQYSLDPLLSPCRSPDGGTQGCAGARFVDEIRRRLISSRTKRYVRAMKLSKLWLRNHTSPPCLAVFWLSDPIITNYRWSCMLRENLRTEWKYRSFYRPILQRDNNISEEDNMDAIFLDYTILKRLCWMALAVLHEPELLHRRLIWCSFLLFQLLLFLRSISLSGTIEITQ